MLTAVRAFPGAFMAWFRKGSGLGRVQRLGFGTKNFFSGGGLRRPPLPCLGIASGLV